MCHRCVLALLPLNHVYGPSYINPESRQATTRGLISCGHLIRSMNSLTSTPGTPQPQMKAIKDGPALRSNGGRPCDKTLFRYVR
ncbi:hypothetical protein BS17DRAFT_787952 [Gyrodon lividus]|nr:hypothetical protein BS17DRAFT_787952 [Gyrodon lividus]